MDNKKIFLALVLLLQGCTTGLAMKAMNGVGMCPPGAIQQANEVSAALGQLAVGDDIRVLEHMTPERRMVLTLRGGGDVEARLYRTGHPRCRNMPTEQDFTPVLVDAQGLVIGVGEVAFHHARSQSLRVVEVGGGDAAREPLTFSAMWKAMPF